MIFAEENPCPRANLRIAEIIKRFNVINPLVSVVCLMVFSKDSIGCSALKLIWYLVNSFSCALQINRNFAFNYLTQIVLTHWGRVTHICVTKLTNIGSNNGLSPGRRQAIIWTNDGILLIWPLRTTFSEMLIGIHISTFKKMRLKMSSGYRRPFCPGLNVLRIIDAKFGTCHSSYMSSQHAQYVGIRPPETESQQNIFSTKFELRMKTACEMGFHYIAAGLRLRSPPARRSEGLQRGSAPLFRRRITINFIV